MITVQIENLAATFSKVRQRPPTAEELKGQIDQYVREEILSREIMKLGLDQNDTIIRRRLQQKMEFLAEDFAARAEPTEVRRELLKARRLEANQKFLDNLLTRYLVTIQWPEAEPTAATTAAKNP